MRLVIRGKQGHTLIDATGQERNAWEAARAKRFPSALRSAFERKEGRAFPLEQ